MIEDGLRRMTPGERVRRAAALTVAAHAFALAEIRRRHPGEGERRWRLRLAARILDPALMRAAFGFPDD